MPKMNPVRLGSVPGEANSKGGINETVPDSVRKAASENIDPEKLSEGPKRGPKGEHKPAAYKLRSGSIRVDH